MINAADYTANIRRQRCFARYILWAERLEIPLEGWERDFLAYQRRHPIPSTGGRRPSGKGLSDAEYAVLRTSRLSEEIGNTYAGRPRKHDHYDMAYHVYYLMRYGGLKKTTAVLDVASQNGVDGKTVRDALITSGDAAKRHVGTAKR